MSNVLISIASQLDNKGFKQADFSIKSLTKSVAKLSGGILTVQKAQQAMFAYMADEKATNVLAQNLKNLGLGFATQSAEEFISVLQKQTGVLDDQLRPAYAQLARVTGSTIETQKLMALAFDVSAGTGTDYTQVIDALSQAYVGNNKGLKSLNIGLSQADLKTKSFADITAILNKQFAGSGDASLESYTGKMALLQVAASDASETIGKGLLDAISTASGPNGFPAFIKGIETAAQVITDLVTGTGRLIALIDIAASPSKGIGDILKKYRALRQQWDREDLAVQKQRSGIANNTSSYMEKQAKDALTTSKISAIQKKLDADRLATLRKQNAERVKQAALDAAAAKLASANKTFDLEAIQLAAAAKSATGEDLLRIKLKQDIIALEDAIQAKNAGLATKLADVVSVDQQRLTALMAQNVQLEKMKGLYDQIISKDVVINFTATGLDAIQQSAYGSLGNRVTRTIAPESTAAAPIASTTATVASVAVAASTAATAAASAATQVAQTVASVAETIAASATTDKETKDSLKTIAQVLTATTTNTPSSLASVLSPITGADLGFINLNPARANEDIVVTIVDNTSGLIDVITDATQQASANGINTRLVRNTGGLNW